MKKCVRCQVEQPLSSFTKRALSPDGLAIYCKSCVAVQKRARRDFLRTRSDDEINAAAHARGPRVCYRCQTLKTPDEFPVDRGRSDGRGQYCKPCSAANTIKYRDVISPELYRARKKASYGRNRETVRRYKLKVNFGITLEQYNEMFEQQDGCCAICRETESGVKHGRLIDLSVDHDHVTGEVRRLLCGSCNKGLGFFMDSPDLLAAAILYLRAHQKCPLSVAT